MKGKIRQLLGESIAVKQQLLESHVETIATIATQCARTLKRGGKIIFCGNGGSAADSQHLAAEFVVRFKKNRRALPALALSTNTSILTAVGNDFSFDDIFSRQLEAIATKKDLLIAISTSGSSPNILKAIRYARSRGIKTVAFTGLKGKRFARSCHYAFVAPSSDTPRIQEAHGCAGHIICEIVERLATS